MHQISWISIHDARQFALGPFKHLGTVEPYGDANFAEASFECVVDRLSWVLGVDPELLGNNDLNPINLP